MSVRGPKQRLGVLLFRRCQVISRHLGHSPKCREWPEPDSLPCHETQDLPKIKPCVLGRPADAYPSPAADTALRSPARLVHALSIGHQAANRKTHPRPSYRGAPIFRHSREKPLPRPRPANRHAPKKKPPTGQRKSRRSSSLPTVLPCQRPPRGVATFRLVSSSAVFSTAMWRSSIRIGRRVFAYRSALRSHLVTVHQSVGGPRTSAGVLIA